MPRMLGRPTLVRLLALLGLAALWVLLEWTRTWFLGGFPWLPLAASQWQRASILQIASYTGRGVSFVLVAVNLGFAAYAHRMFREGETGLRKRSQEFFLAMFLLLVCLSVHVQETFNRGRYTVPLARVALVQPYIPQDVKWDPAKGPGILQTLRATTLDAAATRPDIILWPEAVDAVGGEPRRQRPPVCRVDRQTRRAPLLLGSIAKDTENAVGGRGALVQRRLRRRPGHRAADRLLRQAPARAVRRICAAAAGAGLAHESSCRSADDFRRGTDAAPLIVPARVPLTVRPAHLLRGHLPALARDSVQPAPRCWWC
jgi:hypothetical protein